MKLETLAGAIAAFSQALRRSNAPEHPALLDEFVKFLSGRKEANVKSFLSTAGKSRMQDSAESGVTAGELVPALNNLREFSAGIGKRDIAASLEEVVAFLEERPDIPLAAFGSGNVVSASRRKKTGAAPVDPILVSDYLRKLDAALGRDEEFMQLYRQLQDDDRVTKVEAVEIADRFMGPVPASTSRSKALERILYRHRKLMNFATGSASIGGKKSAA